MYTLHFTNFEIILLVIIFIVGSLMFSKKGKYRIKQFFREIWKSRYPYITLTIYAVVIFMSTILCMYFIKNSSLMENTAVALFAITVGVICCSCMVIFILEPVIFMIEDHRHLKELEFNKKHFIDAVNNKREKGKTEEEILEELNAEFYNTALYEEFAKSVMKNCLKKSRPADEAE